MSYGLCPTDGELLARFTSTNDADAFEEVVGRHAAMVRRVCARLCGCPADAEDVVQNVFVTLARRAGILQTRASVAGWLHRTASHTALRWQRDARTRRRHERGAGGLRPEYVEGGAGLDTRDLVEHVYHALHALPEEYRDALVLHHVQGYTVEQAAELLRARPGTVAARLSRGREMLRRHLHDRGTYLALPVIVELLDAELDVTVAIAAEVMELSRDAIDAAAVASLNPVGAPPSMPLSMLPAVPAGSGATAGMGGFAAANAAPWAFAGKLQAATVFMIVGLTSIVATGGAVTYHVMATPKQKVVSPTDSAGDRPTGDAKRTTPRRSSDTPAAATPVWGSSQGASSARSSVPEPSGVGLIAVAGLAFLRRPRSGRARR